jgi:hypothetical protein
VNRWMILAAAYFALTVTYATLQFFENRRPDPLWAPVWWIALTWPFWIVVIALDLKVQMNPPKRNM